MPRRSGRVSTRPSRSIDEMKARAQALEEEGAERAAVAWQRTIERMESARDTAHENVVALEQAGADAWHDAAIAASEAVNEVEEIGSHAQAFAADVKDDFIAGVRSVVEKSEAELARARARLDEAEGEAKEEWQAVVDNLEEKYANAKAEADKVEEAGADAWGDLRHGFMEAYHDLADAVAEASAEFQDD